MKARIVYPGDKVKVSKQSYLLKAKSFIGSIVEKYKGRYNVMPTNDVQVLQTKGLQMLDDVTIAAIEFALQQKDAAPSETAQIIMPDNGYDGLSQVDISAIPSDYVGSNVPRLDGRNLTFGYDPDNEFYVSAPTGYYPNGARYWIDEGRIKTPDTSITSNPNITVDSNGLITSNVSKSQNITPEIVLSGYASADRPTGSMRQGTITISGSATEQLPVKAAETITPATTDQTIAAGQYLTGVQTIAGDANLIASNIKKNISLFGVLGMFAEIECIYSGQVSANTTNTTATNLTTISVGASAYTKDKLLYVRIRDHAGKRAGYFYGSDTFFMNDNAASGLTNTYNTPTCHYARYTGANEFLGGTGYYGVYGYSIASNGNLVLRTRYNSTNSTTINGTYDVQVFLIDFKFED